MERSPYLTTSSNETYHVRVFISNCFSELVTDHNLLVNFGDKIHAVIQQLTKSKVPWKREHQTR